MEDGMAENRREVCVQKRIEKRWWNNEWNNERKTLKMEQKPGWKGKGKVVENTSECVCGKREGVSDGGVIGGITKECGR